MHDQKIQQSQTRPDSRGTKVVRRAKKMHPRGIQLDFCILIVKIVLDMKPLYSNAARIAFRGKNAFCILIGHAK